MSKNSNADSLSSTLSGLSISTSSTQPPKSTQKAPVADSWDEDDDSTASDTETEAQSPSQPRSNNSSYTKVPPPTPAFLSPTTSSTEFSGPPSSTSSRQFHGNNIDAAFDSPLSSRYDFPTSKSPAGRITGVGDKRPEKSTAVASRLIAAGLGVRAPKRTEEQKEYEKSVRAQERRKKEREIEERNQAKRDAERAKAAIWED